MNKRIIGYCGATIAHVVDGFRLWPSSFHRPALSSISVMLWCPWLPSFNIERLVKASARAVPSQSVQWPSVRF